MEAVYRDGKWRADSGTLILREMRRESDIAAEGDLQAFCDFIAYLDVASDYLCERRVRDTRTAREALSMSRRVTAEYGKRKIAHELHGREEEKMDKNEKTALLLMTHLFEVIVSKIRNAYPGIR